jgi:hypothetical protein
VKKKEIRLFSQQPTTREADMKPMKIFGAGGVLAVVLTLTVVSLTYTDASGSGATEPAGPLVAAQIAALRSEGISSQRAREEIEVEEGVARADLPSKLEAALGGSFGGTWYEPEEAQFHVGVTSPGARRLAEEVAEQAGLASEVTETPVRSTLAELRLAHAQWHHRLATLFEREEVGTSLRPGRNAVVVKLVSSVAAAERAEMEREALAADVNIKIRQVSYPKLRIAPEGRCETWKSGKAYCDPTIAAGVTLTSSPATDRIGTVGPAVIRKDISQDTTETLLLTAGHTVEKAGGLKTKWFAYSKNGTKEEIGEAIAMLTPAKKNSADVGVIRVENPFWKGAALTPVLPQIAHWEGAEPEPFSVEKTALPEEGALTCVSGQTTGTHCGTVESIEGIIGSVKELAVVKAVAPTAKGDSGGPWYSEKEKQVVEGMHLGKVGGQSAFQNLGNTFKYLIEEAKGLSLQLLTESNQTRPDCPMH